MRAYRNVHTDAPLRSGVSLQVHARDAALDNALVMHEFTRDVDEVLSRIAAKAALLTGDGTSLAHGGTSAEGGVEDDLRSVEDLRRTHEALVIQTKSLEDEVARLADEARVACGSICLHLAGSVALARCINFDLVHWPSCWVGSVVSFCQHPFTSD